MPGSTRGKLSPALAVVLVVAIGGGVVFYMRSQSRSQAALEEMSLEELQKATKEDPKWAQAFYQLGVMYTKRFKHKEAHEAYMKAQELAPEDEVIARGAIATTNQLEGPKAAFALMNDFLKRHPDSKLIKDERINLIEVLKLGAERNTSEADAMTGAEKMADKIKAYQKAMEFYQIWLDEVPTDPTAKAGLESVQKKIEAIGQAPKGQRVSREAEFRSLFELSSASDRAWEARLRLAELYYEAGFYPQALEHARAAVKTAMDLPQTWHMLGVVATASSPKEAEEAFATASRLRPNNARALLDLAGVQFANSKPDAAEANYRRAIQFAPEDPLVLIEAGGFLVTRAGAERFALAEKLLRDALRLEPKSTGARYHLGRLALARGQAKDAVRWIGESLRAPPVDASEAYFTYSRALNAAGDSKGAATAIRKSRSLREASFELARAVEDAYRKPQNAALRLRVARLYAKSGDYVKAISQYEGCVLLDPENKVVQREFEDLSRQLTREGKYPDMGLYRAMVESLQQPSRQP